MGVGGGWSKSLIRISFLEAVNGFRVTFLSLCIFLGYEFNVMAVLEAVVFFTKRITLKTLVKSVTVHYTSEGDRIIGDGDRSRKLHANTVQQKNTVQILTFSSVMCPCYRVCMKFRASVSISSIPDFSSSSRQVWIT